MKHEIFRVLIEIIEVICQDHIDETRIDSDTVKGVETLTVIPHMADYPKLIGENGAQVNALNYLVQRAAVTAGVRIGISIKQSFLGEREPIEPFCYNPNFDLEAFKTLLSRMAIAVTGEDVKFTVTTSDQMVICRYPCDRASENASLGGAFTSVLRPYCRVLGRSLYIKPKFDNHETNPELLRHG